MEHFCIVPFQVIVYDLPVSTAHVSGIISMYFNRLRVSCCVPILLWKVFSYVLSLEVNTYVQNDHDHKMVEHLLKKLLQK